jgi:hypothetical protein
MGKDREEHSGQVAGSANKGMLGIGLGAPWGQ